MITELPKLPYSYDALEPYIDAKTMEIHYSKHHATYLKKLNDTLRDFPDLQNKSLEELLLLGDTLPEDVGKSIRNNGGGVYNHNFFWQIMAPVNSGDPLGALLQTILADFGSIESFKTQFKEAALGRFGSGWAWLVVNDMIKLQILSTANQDTPIILGRKPVLALDVWEHAYYLKYQNRRDEYIDNWWNIVNWTKAEELYGNATS